VLDVQVTLYPAHMPRRRRSSAAHAHRPVPARPVAASAASGRGPVSAARPAGAAAAARPAGPARPVIAPLSSRMGRPAPSPLLARAVNSVMPAVPSAQGQGQGQAPRPGLVQIAPRVVPMPALPPAPVAAPALAPVSASASASSAPAAAPAPAPVSVPSTIAMPAPKIEPMPALPAAQSPAETAMRAAPSSAAGAPAKAAAPENKLGVLERLKKIFSSDPKEEAEKKAKKEQAKKKKEEAAKPVSSSAPAPVPASTSDAIVDPDARPIPNTAEFKAAVMQYIDDRYGARVGKIRPAVVEIVDKIPTKVDLISASQWFLPFSAILHLVWDSKALKGKSKKQVDQRKIVSLLMYRALAEAAYAGGKPVAPGQTATPPEFHTILVRFLNPFLEMVVKDDGSLIQDEKFLRFVRFQQKTVLFNQASK
jgi:hypothetical protein